MASVEDIVNIGLVSIGESTITSLSGPQLRQVQSKALYAATRKALLTEIDWRFATTTQLLARQAGTPADTRYVYQYSLPSDPVMLKPQHLSPNGAYERQGNLLLSSATTILLTYTGDVSEAIMPAYFVMLLGLKMGTMLAIPLTKKVSRFEAAVAAYDDYLPKAKFADSSSQPNPEVQDQPFIDARF